MKNKGNIEDKIIKGLGLQDVKAEELLKNYNEVVKKKKLTTTKKVLIAVVTISGIAILPVPIVMYTKRRKDYITSYIDFNIEQMEDGEIRFAKGSTVKDLQAQTVEGYRFDGWYSDSEFQNKMNYETPIEDVKTIYGRYVKLIVVTVNFDGTRHTIEVDENTKLSDAIDKLQDIKIEETEDKKFSGWHINNKYSNFANLDELLTQNRTIYGKYYVQSKVNININGEITSYLIEDTDTLDTLLTKCNLTYNDICGWYTDDKFVNVATELSDNITLYTKLATLDKLSFTEDGEGYSVQGIENAIEGEVVIPMQYNNKPITSATFTSYKSITEVVLPNTITQIPDKCFQNCTLLEKVNFHNQLLTIGNQAFNNTAIKEVKLPASVNSLGQEVFYKCTQLINLEFAENGSLTEISSDAFWQCSALTSVVIPEGITKIVSCSFQSCTKLTQVSLPNSLIELGLGSFLYCSKLTSIRLPENLQSIGAYAFDGAGLTEIYIPENVNTINSLAFRNLDGIEVDSNNKIFYSKNNCIMERDTNTLIIGSNNATIPEETVAIRYSAFRGCDKLENIALTENIEDIGQHAFENCDNLKSVDFTNCINLKTINASCFYQCPKLEKVDFTSCVNLTTLGEQIFQSCTKLTEINMQGLNKLTTIGKSAFYYCSSLTKIDLTGCCALTNICDRVFYNCTGLEEIDLTGCSSITTIDSYAFYGCKSLKNIDLIKCTTLTLIGSNSFYNCENLTEITIPVSVVKIGQYAFGNCKNLINLKFEDTSTWYKVNNSTNWEQMSEGTSVSVEDSTQNATWFTKTSKYQNYYWYKL